jgi:hypothetical protein
MCLSSPNSQFEAPTPADNLGAIIVREFEEK